MRHRSRRRAARIVAALAALAALAMLAAAAPARAQIVNGSLTGPIATGGTPPGWSILLNSPDTMDENNNVGVVGSLDFAAAPSASPDGGTWIGIGTDGAAFNESFGQMMTGLVVGQTYTVSWYASNFGVFSFGYTGANAFEMLVGGAAVGTAPTVALGSGWFAQSMNFPAGATNQQLAFTLGAGIQAYLGIDGIAIQPVRGTVTPEPGSIVMVATGLGLVGLVTRRARRARRM